MALSPGPGLSRLLMSSPLSRSRKLPVFPLPLPAPGAELAPPVLPVTAPPPSRFWKFMFPPMPVPLNRSWSVPSPPDVPARVPVPVGVAGEPLPADVLLVPGEAVAVPEVPEPGDAVVSDVTPLPEEVTDAPLPDDAPDDVPDDAPDDVADDVPDEALEAVEVSGGVADVVPGEASAEVPVVDDELDGELVVTDPARDMAALTEKYTVT